MTATLPGTLPGLLQPGAPIMHVGEHGHLRHGWVVDRPEGEPLTSDDAYVVLRYDSEVRAIPLSRLALDLSRPEGVDRALRWRLHRAGFTRIGLGAPDWRRVGGDDAGWGLVGHPDPLSEARFRWRGATAAATLDPIEALRLACLAAGEVSGG